MKKLLSLVLALLFTTALHAQTHTTGRIAMSNGTPVVLCVNGDADIDTTTGFYYTCRGGIWTLNNGGGGGGGDPWIDVTAPPYNAKGDGSTDDTAAIQAAINAVSATGGTVFCPPGPGGGVYALKGAALSINTTKVRFTGDPKCTLQAQTGFSGAAIISIGSAAADVRIDGFMLDANSIGSIEGIIAALNSTRITIERMEIKNVPAGGGIDLGMSGLGSPQMVANILNNYVHNTVGHCVRVQGNGIFKINDNQLDTCGTGNGLAVDGLFPNVFEVQRNLITNCGAFATQQGCIFDISPDHTIVVGNKIVNSQLCMHLDTNFGTNVVTDNQCLYSTGGSVDYFMEGFNGVFKGNIGFLQENNNLTGANDGTAQGLVVGVVGGGIRSFRNLVNCYNNTTGLTAGTNVTLTSDGADFQAGDDSCTASAVATTNVSFTTGTLFTQNTSPTWRPQVRVWIKSPSIVLDAGGLQFFTSRNTNCTTVDAVLPLRVDGTGWVQIPHEYLEGWALGGLGSPACYGFRLVATNFHATYASDVFKFSDLSTTQEQTDVNIIGNDLQGYPNVVYVTYGMEGGNIIGNLAKGADQTNKRLFDIESASPAVYFAGNQGKMIPGSSGTNFLYVTAPVNASSVVDGGGNYTDAPNYFVSASGGTIAGQPGSTPTISSGFGTSPSVAANQGTPVFTINVGSGGTATSGVIAFNATAPNGWDLRCNDITTHSTAVSQTIQTASSTTTATLTQYNDVMVATAWAANDILSCQARPY